MKDKELRKLLIDVGVLYESDMSASWELKALMEAVNKGLCITSFKRVQEDIKALEATVKLLMDGLKLKEVHVEARTEIQPIKESTNA